MGTVQGNLAAPPPPNPPPSPPSHKPNKLVVFVGATTSTWAVVELGPKMFKTGRIWYKRGFKKARGHVLDPLFDETAAVPTYDAEVHRKLDFIMDALKEVAASKGGARLRAREPTQQTRKGCLSGHLRMIGGPAAKGGAGGMTSATAMGGVVLLVVLVMCCFKKKG